MNIECYVEGCTRQPNLDGLCGQHRRKDIAEQLEYASDGRVWDLCSKGHRWTTENTHLEPAGGGRHRRRCRKCLALKSERKRAEAPVVTTPQPVRLRDPLLQGAHDLSDEAQNELVAKCKGNPGPYMDYEAEETPTDVQAAKLCSGCPLLQACANGAVARKEPWGVWGGIVMLDGEPLGNDRSRLRDYE